MSNDLYYVRTDKGNAELFGTERTLKPRERQLLFLISDPISLSMLKDKMPSCKEMDSILFYLSDNGYITTTAGAGTPAPAAAPSSRPTAAPAPSPAASAPAAAPSAATPEKLGAAKDHALGVLASLVGTRSPVYNKVLGANSVEEFTTALAAAKKTLSAVASPTHAANLEAESMRLLSA